MLKDDATNTWWDNNGSNFTLRLRPAEAGAGAEDEVLPKNLCDKWAWIKWDHEGRPSRSEASAAAEYDTCVTEMRELLRRGRHLDELWQVANGATKYADYISQHLGSGNGNGSATKAAAPPKPAPPAAPAARGPIPEDLLSVQAYVLWERAGKPNGADFSQDARKVIEEAVSQGQSYEQVAARLNYTLKTPQQPTAPAPAPAQQQQQQKAAPQKQQQQQQQAAPAPPKAAQQVSVGKSLDGTRGRNPLDLIKRGGNAPVLSAGKSSKVGLATRINSVWGRSARGHKLLRQGLVIACAQCTV